MLAKTHRLAELVTEALGPVFQAYPNYQMIKEAMGIALGRVAQSTPDVGKENEALEEIGTYAKAALEQFLEIERRKQEILDKGIAGIADAFNTTEDIDTKTVEAEVVTEEAEDATEKQDTEEP